MKTLVVIAVLAAVSGGAAGHAIAQAPVAKNNAGRPAPARSPLILVPKESSPPPKDDAGRSAPSVAATQVSGQAAPSACEIQLAKIATFRPLNALIGPGECGAPDAVLLEAVILPDQSKVPLGPAATLRCSMADAISHWVREDVAPAALKLGAALRGVDNFDSYECRSRNRVRGAKLSEHGRANALDVRGFKLANGHTVGLTDVNVDKNWREGIRASVCARFATVLGPGSDGYHEEHIHLDLAERRNNYKLCEWDVREPKVQAKEAAPGTASNPPPPEATVPLPRSRPVAADAATTAAPSLHKAPTRKSSQP